MKEDQRLKKIWGDKLSITIGKIYKNIICMNKYSTQRIYKD